MAKVYNPNLGDALNEKFYIIERPSNISKVFFTIMLLTDFGRKTTNIEEVVNVFFNKEISKRSSKWTNVNDDSSKRFIRMGKSYYSQLWTNINLLENYNLVIISRIYEKRKGKNVLRDISAKMNTIRLNKRSILINFISASLSKLNANRNELSSYLKENKIFRDNANDMILFPLDIFFIKDEIERFVNSDMKSTSKYKNPFFLAVERFYNASVILHIGLKHMLPEMKNLKDLEDGKNFSLYFKAILAFSMLFENFGHLPYDNINKKFIEMFKDSSLSKEINTAIESQSLRYWNDVIKPVIEIKREYFDLIEKLNDNGRVIEAVDLAEAYDKEEYDYEDDILDAFDMSFPADEEDVKEKRKILEKIKKKYGF